MPVYLDHNATTPLDARALEAMLPYLTEQHGNPSSVHRYGRAARAAVDRAREQVAELVNAHPSQVIFTGCGTEASNLAIKGFAALNKPGLLAIGATEHPSVAEPANSLKKNGWHVSVLPVDRQGCLIETEMEALLKLRPEMISVMWANNETGVVQDIPALAAKVRANGGVMHTDAVQAAGKIEVDFSASGVQLMSLSAHKLNGPKGVGALIADKSVEMAPLLQGGGQEKGRRSGTENVAGIVGFGAAASLAKAQLADYGARMRSLRDRLESELRALGDIEIFGAQASRLPNTVCFGMRGVDGETLLLNLDREGIAISSGSACASSHREPSPVLQAMGIDPEVAQGAIRVSFGAGSTEQDVNAFIAALTTQLRQLRRMTGRAVG
ncbi:MAG: cysteine desulfurase [Candidatus Muproteobacteria bacterium RIFCSPHIGHO2_12_FULL_60_33]|uniref:cysteine desulfurase n=1 Tax=Candidatus Muproteobacteria bacterium RIFCSPLOWO2_01_FULL_60_18 TaxID=1817768 RepID=A0A1F6U0U6_9PROT|nr:MAG: cysteine desulfurase [Candidatus Muproteobacteria bacterium RIFCSPHIGHO2_01_60_12]OGI50995.1 MAG: cysteine desulfurase [Candidatus Muproteobacteria bacterium RIFCSPLOWO2_01_FULL_60_18]OGI55632.1 MAG: cysteine desulfurase [Candidatus Muproteobacteria bacterium RIFCSPHIGHO2_12_FULL_60_33]OGI59895.1 MAG: cysteine desulfurase [Candidatus Muproteobacteria bacterium RIFCSPHIGHO2_01_FULL_61_200]